MRQAQQTTHWQGTAQGAGKARRGVGENLPRARQINHHWVGGGQRQATNTNTIAIFLGSILTNERK